VFALLTLALSGFSLALFFGLLPLDSDGLFAFFIENKFGRKNRAILLSLLITGAVVPLVASLLYLFKRRTTAPETLVSLARRLSPLVLIGLLPSLFVFRLGHEQSLVYLVLLGLFVLSLERLCELSFREWQITGTPSLLTRVTARLKPPPERAYLSLVVLAALLYTLSFSYYTIVNHRGLGTHAFDLGIFDNTFYSALKGEPFYSTVMNGNEPVNIISCHAEYAMLLFLPFYALYPHAETLLVLQSALLGFAAVPLFLFARTLLRPSVAAWLAILYLFFAPLHGANFYDFHFLPLAVFFHFFLYYAIATRKKWLSIAMVAMLFSIREDIPLGLAALGLFLAATGIRPRFGLILAIVSALFFVLNKFVIMRAFGSWWFEDIYVELFADGKRGYGSVLRTLATNPVYTGTTLFRVEKLNYALHMLAPLAFIPLRRAAFVGLLVPAAFFTLLTTAYPATVSIAFQYTTHWIPYLFLAVVLYFVLLEGAADGVLKSRAALCAIGVGVISHSYNFGAILQHQKFVGGFHDVNFTLSEKQDARYRALRELVATIPEDASVAATEELTPHVSNRLKVYAFRYDFGLVDYILVHKSGMDRDTKRSIRATLKQTDYRLVRQIPGDIYLFERGKRTPETDRALKRLGVKIDKPPTRRDEG
jgi:uncharacterized membrane protein